MKIIDIEGSQPKAHEFRTNRVIDPLCPKYKLPSAAEISIDNGRNFIRDPLLVTDINEKRNQIRRDRGL